MNDGVNSTPEQAARSFRTVRLVSFGASAALAVLVLVGVGALRFSPLWTERNEARVVLSEMAREPLTQQETPQPPPRRKPEAPHTPSPKPQPQPQPELEPQRIGAGEPVTVTDPVWISRPRNPERFYPREAFMQGLAGQVVLDCDVDVDGRLTCVVASETPAGRGFGDAALRIANAHVMRPATRDGAPAPARYRMVVPFSPSG